MGFIEIIWIIFGILFLGLSGFHFYQSQQKIKNIVLPQRPLTPAGASVKILGADIDQLTTDLAQNVNEFLDKSNKSNKWTNIIAGSGYLLASATSFFSFYLISTGK